MSKGHDTVPEHFRMKKTWLDGELMDGDASVPIMTFTMHYGIGAFEGIRAYEGAQGPAIFRLKEHIERLFASAAMMRLDMPFSVQDVMQACVDVLAHNGLSEGYLRPLVFLDDGKRGLGAMNNRVRVAVMTWPWGAYLGEEGIRDGIRVTVSGWTRMNPRSFLPKGKICGQYVNSVLAKREALLAGYDESILLDDQGFVSEASGENVFRVKKGVVYTPPKGSPILEGITRDSVMQLAKHLGIPVVEEAFSRGQLFDADEIFLTGTAAEVTPVREVDGRIIGSGGRGPITEKLQTAYFEAVRGKRDGFGHWLTPYVAANGDES